MHDLYADSPHGRTSFVRLPGLVFRSMGLGFMCQALEASSAGVPAERERRPSAYEAANEGSLIIALDPKAALEAFKHAMTGIWPRREDAAASRL